MECVKNSSLELTQKLLVYQIRLNNTHQSKENKWICTNDIGYLFCYLHKTSKVVKKPSKDYISAQPWCTSSMWHKVNF